MALQPAEHDESGVSFSSRVAHGTAAATEMAFTLARSAADALVAANKSARTLAVETYRTLPRLARLGQINDHTRISLGRIMSEQARDLPHGECLLFDGRVHTYEAVDRRINNVVRGLIEVGVRQGAHVGVLMETRPSALVAIAALSRLGAVAVLMPPDVDLATAARLGGVSEIIADPSNLEAARGLEMRVLVLGGGESRDLHLSDDVADVIDMEKIDPDVVDLPGWYRPNPGLARDLAFVGFSSIGGELVARQITNYRWALSAFGTASAANLGRGDTVYCLTPLHHQSGLLVSLGGAVVGGSRIALSRGLRPDRFLQEIRQYGVTVVSYTWAMLREVIDDPSFSLTGSHPVRLFIGSGMPTGLWKRVVEVFAPAHVVEFFATTDGQAVLANVSGAKIGSKGRPLPGGGEVELAAYDAEDDLILEDDRGFVRRADTNEVGRAAGPPARARRPDGVGEARRVRPRRHLGVHRVPVPPRRGRRLLARRQPRLGDPHGARPGLRLDRQRRRRPARRGGSGGDLRGGGGRPAAGRHRAGAAPRRQHSVGRSVRGAGRSAGRQPARHRARGAGDGAQRLLPAAGQPAAGRGHPQAVA